jgi:hypothetical protein
MTKRYSLFAATVLAIALTGAPASVQAQPHGPGWMMGPGIMMGPGMMGGPMWGGPFGGMCDPRVAGMAEWRVEQIERAVKPTEAQRTALNELRAASTKAAEALVGACPKALPHTSAERLAFMETRMEAMLAAIKTVRPAFEAFYKELSDEQKARLDAVGPRRWGWGWRS